MQAHTASHPKYPHTAFLVIHAATLSPKATLCQVLSSARVLPNLALILAGSLTHTFSSLGLCSRAKDPDLSAKDQAGWMGRFHRHSLVLPQGTVILPQVSRTIRRPAHVPAPFWKVALEYIRMSAQPARTCLSRFHHGCKPALSLPLFSTSLLFSLLLDLGKFWWGFLHVWLRVL